MSNPFLNALDASGPAPDRLSQMELYGWLIGSWDLEVTAFLPDNKTRKSPGEWHFGWALEGRAIQDVWIVPPRGAMRTGDAATNRHAYGTTLRTYDPQSGVWHIQWTEPVTQTYLSMIGRREGNDIVQLGKAPDGSRVRWSFSQIMRNSFLWRGETSSDDGRTWLPVIEFTARRQIAKAA